MSAVQEAVDRVQIEALCAEFTDAGMMGDFDRFASLFAADGAWRMPHVPVQFVGRSAIRAGIERMQGLWEYFVQTTHPGVIRLDGDRATGRAYIAEFGRMHNGLSHANYAMYHDSYVRTDDGWLFQERRYEVRYVDATPLPGTAG